MDRKRILRNSAKPRSDLALLLKSFRQRIETDACDLGPHARHPSRLGKRVTQEELAEAVGITREWYAKLESGLATTRASTGLLDRMANALMLTPAERATLFHVAVSELRQVQLHDDSITALQSFSRLRSLTKRLLAATSIEGVLSIASEQLAEWFDGAVLVHSSRRRESGLWEHRGVDDKQERTNAAKVVRDMKDRLATTEQRAALNFQTQLTNAGDIATPDLWPLSVQREVLKVYERHRVAGFAWCYARVQSRNGFIGGLYIAHEFGHSYSVSDLAVIGAFAELASLALS
jgi:transcriptional regulator with XRE-family HTH domain